MFKIYRVLLAFGFVLGSGNALPRRAATPGPNKSQFPRNYLPSGEQMYKNYCASCHVADGKGHGPVSAYLRKEPPDLTTLAKNRGGTFPEEYVATILRFGLGMPAHGSSDMPVWGPIFQQLDNYNEAAVRRRIKNLCDYLGSIQQN